MNAPVLNSVGFQSSARSLPSMVMEGRSGAFHLFDDVYIIIIGMSGRVMFKIVKDNIKYQ